MEILDKGLLHYTILLYYRGIYPLSKRAGYWVDFTSTEVRVLLVSWDHPFLFIEKEINSSPRSSISAKLDSLYDQYGYFDGFYWIINAFSIEALCYKTLTHRVFCH